MTVAATAPSDVRRLTSAAWDAPGSPRIAAVVSTYRRPQFLPGLIDTLANQTLAYEQYEVIVVDNGSGDATWDVLADLVSSTPLRLAVVSLPANRGPGGGRNAGLALVSAPVVAITDDDCLASPGWLSAMLDAVDGGAGLVQGEVRADPAATTTGPWDHVKWITEPTPFFETCNVAYRMDLVRQLGGFDEHDALTAQVSGRAFGEDALLGSRLIGSGAQSVFCRHSVIYHRVIPADFTQYLRDQRNLVGFPGLGVRSPQVAKWFWHRYFLSKQTAAFDVAVLGALTMAATKKRWPLLAAVPWLWHRVPEARHLAGPHRWRTPQRLGQLAVGDAVSLASLIEGSVKHRRVVL
jgi:glycosyltransferase involved in cell wall biosynthesis